MSLRFPHVTHLWWLRGCWPKNGIEERERERLKGETESGGWNGLEKGRRQGVTHHVLACLLSGSVAVLKIVTWEVEKSAMVYPP